MATQLRLYVGTYTLQAGHVQNSQGQGIHVYQFDSANGGLTPLSTQGGIDNPSFLALDSQHRWLYAVSETEHDGTLSAYRIDPASGTLSVINQQPAQGSSTAFVTVDHADRFALLANYGGGKAAVVYPIRADGGLDAATSAVEHHGHGPHADRQEGPHPHSVTLDPGNRYALVPDLGIDKIMLYSFENGHLVPNAVPSFDTAPGAGPRHMAFHPNGAIVYVCQELDSTISTLAFDAEQGTLRLLQTVSMLPDDFSGVSTAADVHVTPDGQYLYASNRGHDSIAGFAIDPASGVLTALGHEPTRGQTPRNFAIDPTGTFLLVANQDSDSIVSFRIDPANGALTETALTTVQTPVCLKFAGM